MELEAVSTNKAAMWQSQYYSGLIEANASLLGLRPSWECQSHDWVCARMASTKIALPCDCFELGLHSQLCRADLWRKVFKKNVGPCLTRIAESPFSPRLSKERYGHPFVSHFMRYEPPDAHQSLFLLIVRRRTAKEDLAFRTSPCRKNRSPCPRREFSDNTDRERFYDFQIVF